MELTGRGASAALRPPFCHVNCCCLPSSGMIPGSSLLVSVASNKVASHLECLVVDFGSSRVVELLSCVTAQRLSILERSSKLRKPNLPRHSIDVAGAGKKKRTSPTNENGLENFNGLKQKLPTPLVDAKALLNQGNHIYHRNIFFCVWPLSFGRKVPRCMVSFSQQNSPSEDLDVKMGMHLWGHRCPKVLYLPFPLVGSLVWGEAGHTMAKAECRKDPSKEKRNSGLLWWNYLRYWLRISNHWRLKKSNIAGASATKINNHLDTHNCCTMKWQSSPTYLWETSRSAEISCEALAETES